MSPSLEKQFGMTPLDRPPSLCRNGVSQQVRRVVAAAALSMLIAGCGTATSAVTAPDSKLPPMAVADNPPPSGSTDDTESLASPESSNMTDKITKTDDEWKQLLTRQQYYVLRQKGTEPPFTNEYDHHFEPGTYVCAACGTELFESDTKFNSGCGWPAFYAAKAGDRVTLTADRSHGMLRTEVTCARCDSHLGHIFDDAPQTPTGQRYCINSVSIKFIPKK